MEKLKVHQIGRTAAGEPTLCLLEKGRFDEWAEDFVVQAWLNPAPPKPIRRCLSGPLNG